MVDAMPGRAWGWFRPSRAVASRAAQAGWPGQAGGGRAGAASEPPARRARVWHQPSSIQLMAEHDFMPLDGWDHVELWVGNAKQAAYYYEHALGFRRTGYAGPETGVRDRASYVLEQNEVRLVVTSAVRSDSAINRHAFNHGDGVKDIALRVPDVKEAYREAV